MDVQEVIRNARDAITVKRVYGDAIEKDGVTVIPAAAVRGGAGGGEGARGEGKGTGSGFGVTAHPVGAFVIKDGHVRWRPAVDVSYLLPRALALIAIGTALSLRMIAVTRPRWRRLARSFR
jgi:uncharacterized spore protein YtfJ